MLGHLEERPAAQHGAPGRLRPLESTARLGTWYEHHRAGVRRDRHPADREGLRDVWRAVSPTGLHRRRDSLLYAAPRSGAFTGRTLRIEGSVHEGARDRTFPRGPV